MLQTDSIRRHASLNWMTILLAVWLLFAAISFFRVFFVSPALNSVAPELSGISTVLIGESGAYLQIYESELDCDQGSDGITVNCKTMFDEIPMILRATRTAYSYPDYNVNCQVISAGSYANCWPLHRISNSVVPLVIHNTKLGISDERWHELYLERGFAMPHFDLEGWVPLTSLLITLFASMAIWIQMGQAFGFTFREQFLRTIAARMIMAAPISAIIFVTTFWNLLVLAWDAESFIIKLWLNG